MLDATKEDPWIKDIIEIKESIEEPIKGMTIRGLKKAILDVEALDVLQAKQSNSSLNSMPQLSSWVR